MKRAAFTIGQDPRDTPIYDVATAAAYLNIPRSTLRHWLKKPSTGRAIIEADPVFGLSFYNLVEAHILKVALERDAWLKGLRFAVAKLRERHPTDPHPLLRDPRYTARGSRSLLSMTDDGGVEDLSRGGQLLFAKLIRRRMKRIDWDEQGRPVQLRPHTFQSVALNYRVSGGSPVIYGTGILVSTVANRALSGETPDEIAHDYGIRPSDVREAIKYAKAA